jgi:hypothetical protein
VIGLVPIFPVTAEVGTSVIPVFVRITKLPAAPRFTGAGPGAAAYALPANANSETAIVPRRKGFMDIALPAEMFFFISIFPYDFLFLSIRVP